MARYEYTVVPFLGKIKYGLRSTETVAEVAKQLAAAIQQHASNGWMFHSINSVNIEVKPGCIASLFGRSTFYLQFDQIVLYKESGIAASSGQSTPSSATTIPAAPVQGPPPIPG